MFLGNIADKTIDYVDENVLRKSHVKFKNEEDNKRLAYIYNIFLEKRKEAIMKLIREAVGSI